MDDRAGPAPRARGARRAAGLADRAVMDHDLTQPSLLSRVRDGADQAAWREFEVKYRELLLRYCRARGLQQSDAEDVRQLVMMNLAKFLRNFDYSSEKGRFRSYLGRVVRNSISRYFSRPNPAEQTPGPEEPPASSPTLCRLENRIKQQPLMLFATRASCHAFEANPYRPLLSAAACVLIEHLRGPAGGRRPRRATRPKLTRREPGSPVGERGFLRCPPSNAPRTSTHSSETRTTESRENGRKLRAS